MKKWVAVLFLCLGAALLIVSWAHHPVGVIAGAVIYMCGLLGFESAQERTP